MKSEYFMKRALELAEKGKRLVNPNPMVGCVIVYNDQIIGEGYHGYYGGNHAEVEAIEDVFNKDNNRLLNKSTMYVTLEPCFHYGKTPPCVDLIIEHKIKKVFISVKDPNVLVAGKSIEKLKKHGIEVEVGLLEKESKSLNKFFMHYIKNKKPYVIYKSASSLDGKIATFSSDSHWISCMESRIKTHEIRNLVMGILTTSATVIKDNASLNVRHVEKTADPVPIILDRRMRLSKDLKIFSLHKKVIVFTSNKNNISSNKYTDNTKIIKVNEIDNRLDINEVINEIGNMGFDSIMVEAGGKLGWSLIEKSLIDEINLFIAPKIIGGKDSPTVMDGNGFSSLSESFEFKYRECVNVGKDILIRAWR